jgi:hypothetical protein
VAVFRWCARHGAWCVSTARLDVVSQSSGTTEDLYGVSFTDANTGTVVGAGGSTLCIGRNDGVSHAQLNTLPGVIVLHDNYPNPFNPITNISFDLARTGRVSLNVYDLLGHLVRTLVNEDLVQSTYTYQWDGTDAGGRPVASGVYYYRAQALGTAVIGAMSLIK